MNFNNRRIALPNKNNPYQNKNAKKGRKKGGFLAQHYENIDNGLVNMNGVLYEKINTGNGVTLKKFKDSLKKSETNPQPTNPPPTNPFYQSTSPTAPSAPSVPSAPSAPSAPSVPQTFPQPMPQSVPFGTPTNPFGTPTNPFGAPVNPFGAPVNPFASGNVQSSTDDNSSKYMYSYIIATDDISTDDNSFESDMQFDVLKARVKELSNAGNNIYAIVKIKSTFNKENNTQSDKTLPVITASFEKLKLGLEDKAPIYTIYKNYKNLKNVEGNASDDRLNEALEDFKNACVITYGGDCVIISYNNDDTDISNTKKLIDFDDTLEVLFDIRFKKIRLAAIPHVKNFIAELNGESDDNIISAEVIDNQDTQGTQDAYGTSGTSGKYGKSGTSGKSGKSGKYEYGKPGVAELWGVQIPYTKEGFVDVDKIQEIGRKKNPKFTVDSHERSDIDKLFIIGSINNINDKDAPMNSSAPDIKMLSHFIPKIEKLLNGQHFRIINSDDNKISQEQINNFLHFSPK